MGLRRPGDDRLGHHRRRQPDGEAGDDSIPACCIAAGNDLIEPGNENDVRDIVDSVAGKTDHPLSIASLRLCASRILRVIAGSSLYEGAKPWTERFETDWFVITK